MSRLTTAGDNNSLGLLFNSIFNGNKDQILLSLTVRFHERFRVQKLVNFIRHLSSEVFYSCWQTEYWNLIWYECESALTWCSVPSPREEGRSGSSGRFAVYHWGYQRSDGGLAVDNTREMRDSAIPIPPPPREEMPASLVFILFVCFLLPKRHSDSQVRNITVLFGCSVNNALFRGKDSYQ